jgi:16S rRNA (guanine527-N7)-methyltransferase
LRVDVVNLQGANRLSLLAPELKSRLEIYAGLIEKWQAKINLIGPSTLADLWTRHFEDSYQLAELGGIWTEWVDLGSGGGFPGLVIALTKGSAGRVHLVESDKRKVAFLREVSRETGTDVEIHVGRIESVLPKLCDQIKFDVISARALAPMPLLVEYARPALEKGALGLFLKGRGLSAELTELPPNNSLDIQIVASRTEPGGSIVVVRAHDSRTNRV